jgi:hypothetical protein
MNEYIEIKFRRHGSWLKVKRERAGRGIELDEPDPIVRSVLIAFSGANDITRFRMRRVRQIKGWPPGQFNLRVSAEGGVLVLRGVDADALPEGRYTVRVRVEEARTSQATATVAVPRDGFGEQVVDVQLDDRGVNIDLSSADAAIARVVEASALEMQPLLDWLDDAQWRPTKKACLLNLLASLRVRPTIAEPLINQVDQIFWISNDRAYARVDRELYARLEALAASDTGAGRLFFREGTPHAEIHLRLLDEVPADEAALFTRESLVSFRGEGRPTLQVVVANPPAGVDHTYAEFDLDLGNPLQDIEGFVVHMSELLDGKPTNHLDLRAALMKTPAREFLYYRIA